MSKIYTAEDAAFRAGVSTRTVVRRITTGTIEAVNVNGTWAISAEQVDKLVALYAAKSSKKAPDAKPARAQQIAIKTTPAPASRKTAATYTAVPQNATEAELAANRARLAEIARRARAAVLIGADGRVGRVKRTSVVSGGRR